MPPIPQMAPMNWIMLFFWFCFLLLMVTQYLHFNIYE